MREIKFRSKVVNHDPMTNPENGWVEGYYLQDLDNGVVKHYIFNCPMKWEVIPETIGQFTGLHDKNDKEIYEGDIVLSKLKRAREYDEILQICFDDGEYCGKDKHGSSTSLSLLEDYHTVEVIGNIHDNPELLKSL